MGTDVHKRAKRLLIVAGETSGDALGAALVRELLARQPDLGFAGLGGPRMAAAGVHLFKDLTAHAVVGIMGLAGNMAGFIRARRIITHELSANRPDAIILIDFPGFNLIIAEHAKRVGVPVIYYVSPQVWAWRPGRIQTIARCVRKMLCVFDFEKDLYERAGVDVTHVGHPLLEAMADKLAVTDRGPVRRSLGLPETGTVIGLLPGSRRKEVQHVFPVLLRSAEILQRELGALTFVTPRAPGLNPDLFRRITARHRPDSGRRADAGSRVGVRPRVDVQFVAGRAHDVMLASDLLLICSGTATLEAALLGTPMIVTYNSDWLSYTIFGSLIRVGFWSLPNIIAGEEIVPEFYIIDAKPKKIAGAALETLDGKLDEVRRKLAVIRTKLGQPGASARAAEEILKTI